MQQIEDNQGMVSQWPVLTRGHFVRYFENLEEDDDGHVLIIDRDLDFNVITEIMGWTWEKDLLHWKRKTNYDEDGMPILDTLTLPDMTKGDKGE